MLRAHSTIMQEARMFLLSRHSQVMHPLQGAILKQACGLSQ